MIVATEQASPAKGAALLNIARTGDKHTVETRFLEELTQSPDQIDLFLQVGQILRGRGQNSFAGNLMKQALELADALLSATDRVRIWEFIATSQEHDRAHREALLKAMQALHKGDSAAELFVDACGIQGEVPIGKAIDAFHRLHDHYAVGCFVLHASGWGVGRVEEIDAFAKEILILFEDGRRHTMPIRSALEILNPISKEDWRVYRAFRNDELQQLLVKEPGLVLAKVLQQVNKPMGSPDLRPMLEGSIVPREKWTEWWNLARKSALLRKDVQYADSRGAKLVYREVQQDNDPFSDMRAVLSARQVLDLTDEYLRNHPADAAADPGTLAAFLTVLIEGSRKHAPPNEPAPLELALLAHEIAEQHKLAIADAEAAFRMMLGDRKSFVQRLPLCRTLRLQKKALSLVKRFESDSLNLILLEIARESSGAFLDVVAAEAIDRGQVGPLRQLLAEALRAPEQMPELLVWARRRVGVERYDPLLQGIDYKGLLDRLLTLGEIKGKRVNPELRRIQRNVARDLTANDCKDFRTFLRRVSLDEARLLRQRVLGLRSLTDQAKAALLDALETEHVDMVAAPEVLAPHHDPTVIYCTRAGISRRNDEYEKLIHVELPKIFEAVGKAASFGDLSENAEYSAALEERATATRRAESIKEELRSAREIDLSLLCDGVVTIGTRITVKNLQTNELVQYTALGPWDADYEHGILDYHAPLALAFLGKTLNTTVEARVGSSQLHFQIVAIEPAI